MGENYIQCLMLDSLNVDDPLDGLGMGPLRSCFHRMDEDLDDDGKCLGILLRVNCMGGSISGMEEVYRLLEKRSRRGIRIVVSISDHALSGGLYVSLVGEKVFALGNSLVGAAGASFVQGRIGGAPKVITTARFKDIYLGDRDPEGDEERIILALLLDVHEDFLGLIARRRPKSASILHEVEQGLVFTGRQAVRNGLVDELGGFEEALEYLRSIVGPLPVRGMEEMQPVAC